MLAGAREKTDCLAYVLLLPFSGREIIFKKRKIEITSETEN